ncbi:MAG: GIY-YIG nuclease family protein [Hyphomicrobiaceae bacterium]|nr:GIY-YIG nuclease family protein [Hyphomicrobiaceae bacterium]
MKGGFCYLMTNRRHGTLYTGVTANIGARAHQHRTGAIAGFTRTHQLTRLVWYERFDDIQSAIARESAIKNWKREWKIQLIEATNPDWRDLFDELG